MDSLVEVTVEVFDSLLDEDVEVLEAKADEEEDTIASLLTLTDAAEHVLSE